MRFILQLTESDIQNVERKKHYMKKPTKALATLAIISMAATMVPYNVLAATGVTMNRLYGTDRIGTAVNVAERFISANTAILAPAADANLVDAYYWIKQAKLYLQ